MSVSRSPRILAAVAVCGLVAIPASAMAATPHAKHGARPAVHRTFAAHGLIVSHTATTATVLTGSLRDGRSLRRNATITVRLATAPRASAAHPLADGNEINLSGVAAGNGRGERFTATSAVEQAAPSHVFLGTVTAMTGTLMTVTKAAGHCSDAGNGDSGHAFTVDVSTAAVTVDGVAGGVLAAGQTVAVLGEGDRDTVLAASVSAFSTAPAVVVGEVSSVDGTVVGLGDGEDANAVDLATATLILNGNPGATVDQVTPGARMMVLGSVDGSGAFTATMAFAFDSGDRGPVGENDD